MAQAAAAFRAARELGGTNRLLAYQEGLVRLAAGDRSGYADACRVLLERAERTQERRMVDMAAWSCTLGPLAAQDTERAIRLAASLRARSPGNLSYAQTLAALLFRLGHREEAESLLQDVIARRAEEPAPQDYFFLALIRRRRNHPALARDTLRLAARRLQEWKSDLVASGREVRWDDVLECEILRREAAGERDLPPLRGGGTPASRAPPRGDSSRRPSHGPG